MLAVGGIRLARRSFRAYRSARNAPKVEADESIDFLIATPKACSEPGPTAVRPTAFKAFGRSVTLAAYHRVDDGAKGK